MTFTIDEMELACVLNTAQFRAECAIADAIAETKRLGREAMERAAERIKQRAQKTSPGSETDSRDPHKVETSGATPEPAIA